MLNPDLLHIKSVHWAEIDELVKAARKVDPLSSLEHLRYYLEKWWCVQYNRPFKDPLLKEYTTNELIYEFLFHHYQKPENDPDAKKQETDSSKEDEEWVKRQLEQIKGPAGAITGSTNPAITPTTTTQEESQVSTQGTPPVLPDHLPEEIKSVLEAGEEFSTRFDG